MIMTDWEIQKADMKKQIKEQKEKEELSHYMNCRLEDTCTRCKSFIEGFNNAS